MDDEQQLGVVATHKSKFTTFVKGPNAVKEAMKAQLLGDDSKHGPTPTKTKTKLKKLLAAGLCKKALSDSERERERK